MDPLTPASAPPWRFWGWCNPWALRFALGPPNIDAGLDSRHLSHSSSLEHRPGILLYLKRALFAVSAPSRTDSVDLWFARCQEEVDLLGLSEFVLLVDL